MSYKRLVQPIVQLCPVPVRLVLALFTALVAVAALVALLSLGSASVTAASALQIPTPTTTSVTWSTFPTPPKLGTSVDLIATVTPITCTGVVFLHDGGTLLGVAALVGGNATFTTDRLSPAGNHSIVAVYDPSGFLCSASSGTLDLNVAKGDTVIDVDGPGSSVYGETGVTFNVTVRGDPTEPIPPTGMVELDVDVEHGDNFDEDLPLGLPSAGQTSFTIREPLPVGDLDLKFKYAGDANYEASNELDFDHDVEKADTETTVTSNISPTVVGQVAFFNVQVTAVSPGSGIPTGEVELELFNGVVWVEITRTNMTGGGVSFQISDLEGGTNTIRGDYNGDDNFNGSTSDPIDHEVGKADSNTELISSANPSDFGQSVTFTATVEAAGLGELADVEPAGDVTFKNGGTDIPGCTNRPLSSPEATCTVSDLDAGSHTITAEYGGDTSFNPSTSAPLVQRVNRGGTTTTLTSDKPSNSSAVDESVIFEAEVTSSSGTPSGEVTFLDGGGELSTETLDGSGKATFAVAFSEEGLHPMKARYNGAPNFPPSESDVLFHTVSVAGSTTTLTITPSTVVFGQEVTLKATVATIFFSQKARSIALVSAPDQPTGLVTFRDIFTPTGGTQQVGVLGPVPLSGGVAELKSSSLAAGQHAIRAIYEGDGTVSGSVSDLKPLTVNQADTVTTITGRSPTSSVVGQSVVVSFTVTAQAPGSGTPTGSVTVDDGGGATCTGTIASEGTCTLTPATAGSPRTLTATYSGDPNFKTSSGTATHTVSPADTTTTVTSSPNPSEPGQTVTINATVTVDPPGSGIPTGTVRFTFNGAIGDATLLPDGRASITHTFPSEGLFDIKAEYLTDGNYAGSEGTVPHEVRTLVDISVNKTDSPDPVNAGHDVTYEIEVTNPGLAMNVDLTDTLPSEVTFVSIEPGGWACTTPSVGSGGAVECSKNVGTGTETFTVVVNVPDDTPAGKVLRNTVEVNGEKADPDLSNNIIVQETTVIRTPRLGDCNGDDAVDVADVWSIVRDIFDTDFSGPAGCDANKDAQVDAGDIPCTVLIMFDGPDACGISRGLNLPLGPATASEGPALVLQDDMQTVPGGRAVVPITFEANGHSVTSLVFSVDYDESWLAFDPADVNADGIPDAVAFSLPGEFSVSVEFDAADTDGELDIVIADIFPPLTSVTNGVIGLIMLDAAGSSDSLEGAVYFSLEPEASFGSTSGLSIPGTATPAATPKRYQIFLPLVRR